MCANVPTRAIYPARLRPLTGETHETQYTCHSAFRRYGTRRRLRDRRSAYDRYDNDGTIQRRRHYEERPRYNGTRSNEGYYGVVDSIDSPRGGNSDNAVAGTIIGGIIGGVIGHQIGSGTGNTVATVAGAVGGAAVGHEIGQTIRTGTSIASASGSTTATTRPCPRPTSAICASATACASKTGAPFAIDPAGSAIRAALLRQRTDCSSPPSAYCRPTSASRRVRRGRAGYRSIVPSLTGRLQSRAATAETT